MPQKDVILLLPYLYVGAAVIGFGYIYFYAECAHVSGFTKQVAFACDRYSVIHTSKFIDTSKSITLFKYF